MAARKDAAEAASEAPEAPEAVPAGSDAPEAENASEGRKARRSSKVNKVVVSASRSQVPDNVQDGQLDEWTVNKVENPHIVLHAKSDGSVHTKLLSEPRGGTCRVLALGFYEAGQPFSRQWGASEVGALKGVLDFLGVDVDQVQLETEFITMPEGPESGHRYGLTDDDGTTFEVVEHAEPVKEGDEDSAPAPVATEVVAEDPPVTTSVDPVFIQGPPEGAEPPPAG